jgi:predicted dehydrogenase
MMKESSSSGKGITRRGFISTASKGLVVAGVAGGLFKGASAQSQQVVPDPPGKKLGWAVVGLGSLAINQILPAFAKCEKSKVVALVSGHPEKAKKLAERYDVSPKAIYNYQNYDSIRDNPEVDIIYVVLPNGMHAEYTVRGFQAGKHVLTEKPMANTPAECQQMIDAANKAGKKLMVAYRCRYEPFTKEAIRIVRSGELGPTQVIVADAGWNATDPTQWRLNKALAGGGALLDIGIYALQATRFLSGEEPVEVNAMMYTTPGDPRFKEVEQTISWQMRFPNGIMANCTTSYGYASQSHYRVVGTKGLLEMDPGSWYRGNRMRIHQEGSWREIEIAEQDHFALEMDHMSDCVMQNKTPFTPGEEGLRDMKLMMAIYESARSGKPVKV